MKIHARTMGLCLALVSCGQLQLQDNEDAESYRAARFDAIASLQQQLVGTVSVDIVTPASDAATGIEFTYILQAPHSDTEDTDIRGFIDGSVKYDFNQATSYHMRVGRRYAGAFEGRHELKRSLVRWRLPSWPAGVDVSHARIVLWVERFMLDSPLLRGQRIKPLHLYAYPLHQSWAVGHGGVEHNDFSVAETGESTWTDARKGEVKWADPGALPLNQQPMGRAYADAPIAFGTVEQSDAVTELGGRALATFVAERAKNGGTVDVLLKLDDAEEDRWGTEIAMFSSDFGNNWDVINKRPALNLRVRVPGNHDHIHREVILESGSEQVLPVMEHQSNQVVIDASFVPAEGSEDARLAPDIWIRGGAGAPTGHEAWIELVNPLAAEWKWSQIRVTTRPNVLDWGEQLRLQIRETWVSPGPRDKQVPELLLVSPSDEHFVVSGQSTDAFSYTMSFQPQEFGLWRYGWSFQPSPERALGSHVGEGAFFVSLKDDVRLKRAADDVLAAIASAPQFRSVSTYAEAFVREATKYSRLNAANANKAEGLVLCVRRALAAKVNGRAAGCDSPELDATAVLRAQAKRDQG